MILFRSAVIRLTFWYLGILMLLSFIFSVVVYRVSTHEFDRELRQTEKLKESALFVPRGFTEFNRLRLAQINESKDRIQTNLALFNLIILGAGGIASYLLAQRTLRPIEEALEAQERFTTDASHELRTPLTAMKTELEVALRDPSLSLQDSRALHKSTLEEIGKLETLTNGLLTLSRSGAKSSILAPCEMHVIFEGAKTKVAAQAKAKKITLLTDKVEGTVRGDCARLQEVVSILLDNAIKYSAEQTTVTLFGEQRGENVVVTVHDEGAGIAATDLPHIFERFYRADASRTKHGTAGYGLGLSIAQETVITHGGSIKVASELGKGTTFTVTLPAYTESHDKEEG